MWGFDFVYYTTISKNSQNKPMDHLEQLRIIKLQVTKTKHSELIVSLCLCVAKFISSRPVGAAVFETGSYLRRI